MIFKTKTEDSGYFLSQPHQPFFILGVVNAVVFMLIFMLAYKGVVDLSITVPIFHSYSLIFLVFSNFFIGFLFTTFPRFTQSIAISKSFYTNLFYVNLVASILFLSALFVSEVLTVFAMVTLLVSHVFMVAKLQSIYKKGVSPNKKDPFWILTALYFGIVGQVLLVGAVFRVGSENLAVNLSFYLYLIFLTFSIAQRMIPLFSHSMESKDGRFVGTVFAFFVLKVASSVYDTHSFVQIFEIFLDMVIAYYMFREFLAWKLLKRGLPAILWVLHLGLFWLPTAFLFSALSQFFELFLGINFYFLGIHLMALGFLTTVFVGFGTRVVLGHSGKRPHADKFASNIFLFMQMIVVLRALFSLNVAFAWGLNFIFDITVGAWLVLFLLWGSKYGKTLFCKNNI